MEAILKYEWNHELIEFEVIEGRVMVNATQMGNGFDRSPKDFLKTENTQLFIKECLKKENSPFIFGFQEDNYPLEVADVVHGGRKNGTWMHRILALKFAAWLDPAFELWVYITIDRILFDHYRRMEESLRRSANRQNKIEEIKKELSEIPEFLELQTLELEERQEAYRRSKENRSQLDLFRGVTDEENLKSQ
jgi:hypothetical protein